MGDIEKVQSTIWLNAIDPLLQQNAQLQADLDMVVNQEEFFWHQKSQELWLQEEERNTSFFHASTIIRRRKSKINNESLWVEQIEDIERLVTDFFRNLYQIPIEELFPVAIPHGRFPAIEDHVWTELTKPFEDAEIVKAFKQMGALKAPGNYGFQLIFFGALLGDYKEEYDKGGERFLCLFYDATGVK
ncbi:hypothetical protein V2J09_001168 [Rumex salicifolius]